MTIAEPRVELSAMLRPAGGGLYVVSTGREAQLAVQRGYYGVSDEASIHQRFLQNLERVATARAVIVGVPSDVGAGYRRGANLGP
ncbi:MAG: arginase family protein, partial [Deltaproteobacteria bacterium]|nr:arginase family protein [Deltaproteobacteria bacterium]